MVEHGISDKKYRLENLFFSRAARICLLISIILVAYFLLPSFSMNIAGFSVSSGILEAHAAVNADFDILPLGGNSVRFIDQSTSSYGFNDILIDMNDDGLYEYSYFDEGVPLAPFTHTYASAGTYTVHLRVTNFNLETDNAYMNITVPVPVVADFKANMTGGMAPLMLQFTDTSTGSPTSWQWNFGDGTANGTIQNPVHTYTSPGTYTVTLTVTSPFGSSGIQKVNLITVLPGSSKFHSVLNNSGVYDDGGVRPNSHLAWSFTTGGQIESTPALVNGILYFGSDDHKVYALDAVSGTQLWSFTTGGVVHSSPAVANGIVYVGSEDGKLYALDMFNGTQLWSYTTGGWVDSSPAIVDGKVIFGSNDYNVYALDMATSTLLWSFTTGNKVLSSPAVANGVVYIGSYDGIVYALDEVNGTKLWSYNTGTAIESSPAVVNNVVYIGNDNDDLIALDATSGTFKWSYNVPGTGFVVSTPAVAYGMVYFGGADGRIYALDADTGAYKWKVYTYGLLSSSPAVANGVVYIGTWYGRIYAFNATTGAFRWEYTTNSIGTASPVVANGVVYIGSTDSKMYALGSPITGPIAWKFRSSLDNSGIYDDGGIRPGKSLVWSFVTGQQVTSSPAVVNGVVYVGSWNNKVYAFDAISGAQLWSYTTGNFVSSSPAVANGVVYVGSWDNKVYALDAVTGEQKWSYTTGGAVTWAPVVAKDVVYVGSNDNKVYALDAVTGALKWSYTTGNDMESCPAVVYGMVYIGSLDGKVYALDAVTGALKWSFTSGDRVETSPVVVNGKVFFGSYDGKVYALNAINGTQLWSFTTGAAIYSSPAVVNGVVYIGSDDNKVYALDAVSGGQLWNFTTGNYVLSSPAVANGVVYIGSWDNKVYALDAVSGGQLWNFTTGSGVRSSPAVANGIVYVGCDNGIVYAFGTVPPVAYYTSDVTSGLAPLKVQFTDASTNIPTSWQWNFGDGSNNQSIQNPQHTFMNPGTYTVTLTATNDAGSDSLVKIEYISVSPGHVFGGTGTDSFTSVVAAIDGYVTAGQTYSAVNTSQDVYIVKTDTNGNYLWSKTLGGVNDQIGHGIVAVSDGYVITGWAIGGSGDWDIYLVKVDLNGELVWEHQYGIVLVDETGNSIAVTSDGGFIITGYRKEMGTQDILLTKTYSDGNLQWSRSYDGWPDDEIGNHVIAVSDGYVVAGGSDGWNNPASDVLLMKTFLNGTLQWRKTYGGSDYEWGYGVAATSDGGYIVAGCTKSYGNGSYEAYLVKAGPDGTWQWDRPYGGTGSDTFYSVVPVNDGYVIGGGTSSWGTSGSVDAWLVKTDQAGIEQWNKTYGGYTYDEAWSVISVSNGFVMAGWSQSFGAGDWDAYLVITDPNGNMPYRSQVGGGPNDENAESIIAVSDGYVIAGGAIMGVTGSDIFLGKTDLNLNYVWQKTYLAVDDQMAYQVISTGDGYLVVGYTDSGTNYDGYVLKTDLNGNKVWDATFSSSGNVIAFGVAPITGGYMITGESWQSTSYDPFVVLVSTTGEVSTMKFFGTTTYDEGGYSIVPVSDGYVIAGYVTTASNGADNYLLKVDLSGNLLWEKTFGGTGDDFISCSSLLALSDGFIVTGVTTSFGNAEQVYLAKLDVNGIPVWEKAIGGEGNQEGWSLAATGDGYIITGTTGDGEGGPCDLYLVKTNLNGNMVWEKTFGGDGDDVGSVVIALSDGYVVAGWTNSYGSGGNDVYMVKVNKYLPIVSTINMLYSKVAQPENRNCQVWITRNDFLGSTCTIYYSTTNGTAYAGQNYTAATSSVTFKPDETKKVIWIHLIDDRYKNGDRDFTVTLTSAVNAALGPATGTVCTIKDNDRIGV